MLNRTLVFAVATIVVVSVVLVCAFSLTLPKNNPIDTSDERVQQQIQEIKTAFQTQKAILTELHNVTSEASCGDIEIEPDGYFRFGQQERIWMDSVSADIPKLFDNIGDTRTVRFHTMNEPLSFAYLEIYYASNQMMYTVVYSETDLVQLDSRYHRLEENWYLWITGMT